MLRLETLDDIGQLITGRIEEGQQLEYKAEIQKNNGHVRREATAFANTAGGLIVFGIEAHDRVPIEIAWIRETGLEERLTSILLTNIDPPLVGFAVYAIRSSDRAEDAIYVVAVDASLTGPHMTSDGKYYRRRGSITSPMEHDDVKAAMVGVGRRQALVHELQENVKLLDDTRALLREVEVLPPEKRHSFVLIPFHDTAWQAMILGGLSGSLKEPAIPPLFVFYEAVHSMNAIIGWLHSDPGDLVLHTPAYSGSGTNGTYVIRILEQGLLSIHTAADELRDHFDLSMWKP